MRECHGVSPATIQKPASGSGRFGVPAVVRASGGDGRQMGSIRAMQTPQWTRIAYPSRRLLSAHVSAFLDHPKNAFPNGTPNELAAHIRNPAMISLLNFG